MNFRKLQSIDLLGHWRTRIPQLVAWQPFSIPMKPRGYPPKHLDSIVRIRKTKSKPSFVYTPPATDSTLTFPLPSQGANQGTVGTPRTRRARRQASSSTSQVHGLTLPKDFGELRSSTRTPTSEWPSVTSRLTEQTPGTNLDTVGSNTHEESR
jgi:hypothetical protein